MASSLEVKSPDVAYTEDAIVSKYLYQTTRVTKGVDGALLAEPLVQEYTFRTERKVPKTGVLLVGLGGNNGTTVTAGIIANKKSLKWNTKEGEMSANYWGSMTQSSTLRLGSTSEGEEIYVPLKDVLPMVSPNDMVISGWDISSLNLADSMKRARVLDYDLQRQVQDELKEMVPMPSIYYPDFIAANQEDRADNVIPGKDKQAHLEHIRKDIRDFKAKNGLDKVIILWTANTERFVDLIAGVNDTAENILKSISESHDEVSPSNIFAVASILEGCSYVNGSPQNTFTPGILELALKHRVFIGGDDFKSGQTKMKSVLVDFLVSAGIKPRAIVSYNHLGNNDGKNLSAPQQFRSKEISKSNVVDDMVASNRILYKEGEHPDHVVVIKYVPFVADSKRAMDEYSSSIFLNGLNTIVMHNTCEDSLLAAPLIIDLVILMELMERITFKTADMAEFDHFHPVASILSYLLKAPLVPQGTPIVNSLFRQRSCIENVFRACLGLPAENSMLLEHKMYHAAAPKAAEEEKVVA